MAGQRHNAKTPELTADALEGHSDKDPEGEEEDAGEVDAEDDGQKSATTSVLSNVKRCKLCCHGPFGLAIESDVCSSIVAMSVVFALR